MEVKTKWGKDGLRVDFLQISKIILNVAAIVSAYVMIGCSLRQEAPSMRSAAEATAASSPSDFPEMPGAICRQNLNTLWRSYRNAPLPSVRSAARDDYNALVVQASPDCLLMAHLPSRLP